MKVWLGIMVAFAVQFFFLCLGNITHASLMAKRLKKMSPEEYAARAADTAKTANPRSIPVLDRLEREAREVGVKVSWPTVLAVLVGVPVAVFVVCYGITRSVVASLAVSGAGVFAPELLIRRRRRKRYDNFLAKFDAALLMAASALQAGASVQQAFEEIAQKASPVVGEEFMRVVQAMKLGATPGDGVKVVLEGRVPGPETQMFVVATQSLMLTGGNLADVYAQLAAVLVEQREFRDGMKAATGEGRVTATVITVMPVILVALVLIGNPAYFDPLMAFPGGRVLLFACGVAIVVGWAIIRKIMQVQVD